MQRSCAVTELLNAQVRALAVAGACQTRVQGPSDNVLARS